MYLKNKVGFPQAQIFIKYLSFQSFDFERTGKRIFQKRVMRTNFDIYVFITGSVPLLVDYQSSQGIIRPVFSASALSLVIINIYCCNMQFLNNVIINKTKHFLPQTQPPLANRGYPVQALWFSHSQKLINYLAFQSFDYEVPGEDYSRNASCGLNQISRLYYINIS